jgi:hypothetical protein
VVTVLSSMMLPCYMKLQLGNFVTPSQAAVLRRNFITDFCYHVIL